MSRAIDEYIKKMDDYPIKYIGAKFIKKGMVLIAMI